MAEALGEGLKVHAAAQRSQEILNSYKQAFGGFNETERLALDEVWLEDSRERR